MCPSENITNIMHYQNNHNSTFLVNSTSVEDKITSVIHDIKCVLHLILKCDMHFRATNMDGLYGMLVKADSTQSGRPLLITVVR